MRRFAIAATVGLCLAGVACTSDTATPSPAATAEATSMGTATPRPTPTSLVTPSATRTPVPNPEELVPEVPDGVPLDHPGASALSDAIGPDGWPGGAIGPLVVFQRLTDEEEFSASNEVGSIHTILSRTREYVTYDLGAGRELFSFAIRAGRGPSVRIAGAWVFANYHGELWVYALDGSGGRRLLGGDPSNPRELEYVAPNADGSLVAVAHYRVNDAVYHDDMVLDVLDVATGDVTFHVTQAEAEAGGIVGFLSVGGWSPDNQRLYVFGHAHKDGSPYAGTLTLATRQFDFAERTPGDLEFFDPLAVRPTWRVHQPWCQYGRYAASASFELLDSPHGAVLNSVSADAPVFTPWDASPDGREWLYRMYDLPPDVADALTAAYTEGDCGVEELQQRAVDAPYTLHILRADGGPPIEVASVREAYARWYGADRLVTFACGDEEVVGRSPYGDPQFDDPACGRDPIELRVGGRQVGVGRDISVLGFIDAPVP